MTTIRTSHAGSLPRTPELIEANKVKQAQNTARLAGESVSDAQEKEFDELLAASVRSRQAPEEPRHLAAQRRRVRPRDGCGLRLRCLVALLLRPHRRARAPRPQHLRRARQPVDARQYCPDELLRPPRSQPVPERLC